MKPGIGKIVHYIETVNGTHLPAIITKVWSPTVVNLQVFQDDSSNPVHVTSVPYVDVWLSEIKDCWHWPERT